MKADVRRDRDERVRDRDIERVMRDLLPEGNGRALADRNVTNECLNRPLREVGDLRVERLTILAARRTDVQRNLMNSTPRRAISSSWSAYG
jgi:hypothetical protein